VFVRLSPVLGYGRRTTLDYFISLLHIFPVPAAKQIGDELRPGLSIYGPAPCQAPCLEFIDIHDHSFNVRPRCSHLCLCILGCDEPLGVGLLDRVFVGRDFPQCVPLLRQVPGNADGLFFEPALRLAPGGLLCRFLSILLFDRYDYIRLIFAEPLALQMRNELWKGKLPWLLPMVRKFSELLWVQAELARHLDMGMREVKTLPCIDPDLQVTRNSDFGHLRLPPASPSPVCVDPLCAAWFWMRQREIQD